MYKKKFLVIPLVLIILSSGIAPFSFASVESEAQEDIQAGCRDGQMLVYRATYHDFVCVEPSTADRWVELGLAEIVEDYNVESSADEKIEPVEELPPVIVPSIPERTPSVISDNSECREGYTLVYRFIHKDTLCTSPSTASTWERLGLAEIVNTTSQKDESLVEIVSKTSEEEELISEEAISEETLSEETISEETISEETISEETISEETISEEESSQNTESENISEFPQINQIEEGIWAIVDSDNTSSVLIEGEGGIIAIDSLNSYESMKQILDEFKTISDKKIKSIVLTTINPEILFALNAFLENGDGDVEIIINQELLEIYENDNDAVIKNAIPFSPEITLNVIGVDIELVVADGYSSDHTYVFLPEIGGVIIGDSNQGVFPTVLDIEYLRELRD